MQYKTLTKFATKAAQFTATIASAALVASTALVPKASAFTLRKADDGRIIGIDALEVEGNFYNVEFKKGSFNEVFGGDLDFKGEEEVLKAWEAVKSALGDTEFTTPAPDDYLDDALTPRFFDVFMIPGFLFEETNSVVVVYDKFDTHADRADSFGLAMDEEDWWIPWAKFSSVGNQLEDQKEEQAATPEPSLIFGFITLGGFMLGSKRKTKG